ncbi:MAG: hypothetical protein ACREPQ_00940 [Rhodanobacter sp.]
MTKLRRFSEAEHARVHEEPAPSALPESSTVEPVGEMDLSSIIPGLDAEPASTVERPVAVAAEASPVLETETPTVEDVPSTVLAEPSPKRGVLAEQLLRPAPAATRPMRDMLVLLKSLSPVLRAGLLFPGPEAAPEEYADAVRRMSASVKSLADTMTQALQERDPLELDTRWARKAVQEVAADLVSNHWVATVLARGGAGTGEEPAAGVPMLAAGVREALAVAFAVGGRSEAPQLSHNGAVRLSFLKAFAPLAIEIDKYAHTINGKLDASIVDATVLQTHIGELLMAQATDIHQALMEGQMTTEDDQRMALQACLSHVGAVLMALWEPTRGDALGTLVDAPTVDAGREALSSAPFEYGFPLGIYQERVGEAVRRLTGTVLASMALVRSASPRQEGDACP